MCLYAAKTNFALPRIRLWRVKVAMTDPSHGILSTMQKHTVTTLFNGSVVSQRRTVVLSCCLVQSSHVW
jgi:hypothetical protein